MLPGHSPKPMTDEQLRAASSAIYSSPIPDKRVPTMNLRWRNGVLEQMFYGTGGGTPFWVPVPNE